MTANRRSFQFSAHGDYETRDAVEFYVCRFEHTIEDTVGSPASLGQAGRRTVRVAVTYEVGDFHDGDEAFCFDYVEPSDGTPVRVPRRPPSGGPKIQPPAFAGWPVAVLKIMAAPRVSIRIEEYKKVLNDPKRYGIQIEIVRVQEGYHVPPRMTPLDMKRYLTPRLMFDGQLMLIDDAVGNAADFPGRSHRPHNPFPVDAVVVEPRPDGVVLYSLEARRSVRIRVPTHDVHEHIDDVERVDALAHFSFYVWPGIDAMRTLGSGPAEYWEYKARPLVIVTVTEYVDIDVRELWDTPIEWMGLDKIGDLPGETSNASSKYRHPFYYVKDLAQDEIPSSHHTLELADLSDAARRLRRYEETRRSDPKNDFKKLYFAGRGSSADPPASGEGPLKDYYRGGFLESVTARDALVLSAGCMPIIGDFVDVGEFIYATFSGKDFTGRKLELGEYILLFFYVLPGVTGAARTLRNRTTKRLDNVLAVEREIRASPDF